MKYKRIVLKLSGEALGKEGSTPIAHEKLVFFTEEIKNITRLGVQIILIVGGGNIHRGSKNSLHMERVQSDKLGMLATVVNGIALHHCLMQRGVSSVHMTSFHLPTMLPFYTHEQALEALQKGAVVLLTGGLGLPLVTTDTAASLRGIELQADAFLKSTGVDGIYASDPKLDPSAVKFHRLSFQEAMGSNLDILDQAAFALCATHRLPIVVFNGMETNALLRVVQGESIGTLVGEGTSGNRAIF